MLRWSYGVFALLAVQAMGRPAVTIVVEGAIADRLIAQLPATGSGSLEATVSCYDGLWLSYTNHIVRCTVRQNGVDRTAEEKVSSNAAAVGPIRLNQALYNMSLDYGADGVTRRVHLGCQTTGVRRCVLDDLNSGEGNDSNAEVGGALAVVTVRGKPAERLYAQLTTTEMARSQGKRKAAEVHCTVTQKSANIDDAVYRCELSDAFSTPPGKVQVREETWGVPHQPTGAVYLYSALHGVITRTSARQFEARVGVQCLARKDGALICSLWDRLAK